MRSIDVFDPRILWVKVKENKRLAKPLSEQRPFRFHERTHAPASPDPVFRGNEVGSASQINWVGFRCIYPNAVKSDCVLLHA